MNKGALAFALLMVALGVAFNFYLLSLIGILIFVPALLSSGRRPPSPVPAPPRQETRRISPPKPMKVETPAPSGQQMPMGAVSMPPPDGSQSLNYSPSLFPAAMFPSLSQMGRPAQTNEPTPPTKAAERDEVIEMGAVLALMKLVFG